MFASLANISEPIPNMLGHPVLDGKSRWSVKVDRDKHLEQIPGALGDPICNIAQERIWYLAPLENEPWGHFNLLLAKKFLLYKKGWPELLSHGLKFSCQETLLIFEDLLNSFSIVIWFHCLFSDLNDFHSLKWINLLPIN